MELSEVLTKAWSDVQLAELPDHLQEIAFREVVQHMLRGDQQSPAAGTTTIGSSPREPRKHQAGENDPLDGSGPKESDIYRLVSEHTGVEEVKIEKLVYLDDDEIRVLLPGVKLGKSNADGTRAVAQILTVARGFGFGEEGTLLSTIRTECNRLKVHDSANFSSYVSKIPGFVVSGTGNNRRLRIRSGGVQAFADLVGHLLPE